MPGDFQDNMENLWMCGIMKLGYEVPISDGFDFRANFKRHIKSAVYINQSSNEV